jgi:predicted PurR-regulated permease PerM
VLHETREKLKGTDNALLTGILVTGVLYFAREVFIPLALAGLLAFLLAPAATRLERWGMKRAPAALMVILLSVAGIGALGWVVLEQIYSLAIELPQYQQNVTGKIDALHLNSTGKLSSTVAMLSSVGKQITSGGTAPTPILSVAPVRRSSARASAAAAESRGSESKEAKPAQPVAVRVEEPEESMLAVAGRTVTPLVHPLVTTFIVVVFLVFMLLGREDLRDRGLRLAGSGRMHVTTTAIEDASRRVSRYLRMQLVVNLSYGVVVGLLLWWIGVPNPVLWGVLTCLLRFVPYIGIMMAAAGPILLAIAVSPQWGALLWTVLMFVVLEIVTANFVEPTLYGASTGISAMAILIAAIFWTLLWGWAGLLLSTPLTVCLIVIGRQVPQLRYLEVLFGEETVLPPPERFYQRMLASHTGAARAVIEEMLKTRSKEEVFDAVLVPTLSLIEEARHSEQITGTRAEEILQGVEELAEDVTSRAAAIATSEARPAKRLACVPARDFADEVACQLALQVLTETASVRVVSSDSSTAELMQVLDRARADIICVVGVPPHAIRHIRMRCHQIRGRFPDAVVVACVLSLECDLSNVRSRIPMEDAQHVVCSLQLLKEYLSSLLPIEAGHIEAAPEVKEDGETRKDLNEAVQETERVDLLDGPEEGIFDRLAISLARSFDAPIALIMPADGERHFWEVKCGLPEESLTSTEAERDLSICSKIAFPESTLVVSDTAELEAFASDSFLKANGIRFYAGTPLKTHDGEVIGSVCVLDTRPRQVTEKQKENLMFVAEAVATAIELHGTETPSEAALEQQEA